MDYWTVSNHEGLRATITRILVGRLMKLPCRRSNVVQMDVVGQGIWSTLKRCPDSHDGYYKQAHEGLAGRSAGMKWRASD